MDSTSIENTQRFLDLYERQKFKYSKSLFKSIKKGAFTKVWVYPRSQPCNDLSKVWKERAWMFEKNGFSPNKKLLKECLSLVDTLSEYPEEPCQLWRFEGCPNNYSVFEAKQSKRIVGCIISDNNDGRVTN